MKAWKQIVMQEVGQELQVIRQEYGQATETQRRDFVMELERVDGRLYEVEAECTTLKNEVKTLKAQKYVSNQRSTLDASKSPTTSPNPRPIQTPKNTEPIAKSYAQIAASNSTKSATKNG